MPGTFIIKTSYVITNIVKQGIECCRNLKTFFVHHYNKVAYSSIVSSLLARIVLQNLLQIQNRKCKNGLWARAAAAMMIFIRNLFFVALKCEYFKIYFSSNEQTS